MEKFQVGHIKTWILKKLKMAHISEGSNLEMGENVSASSSSESKESLIDVELLEGLQANPTRKCCIYRVPRNLRKINEGAYTPQVVSIGPLHRGKEHLIEMEKQKERYVEKFVERTSKDKLEEFTTYIEDNESRIRSCYAENPIIEKEEFVNIILHDAVFIIELFLRDEEFFGIFDILQDTPGFREFDILLDTPFRRNALDLDLQLLENQLPYFVLKELFSKLNYRDPFLNLVLKFFYASKLDHITHDIRHFTDLRRCLLLKGFNPPNNPSEKVKDVPCATKLAGSGVKFKKGAEKGSSLKISCQYITRPSQLILCNKVRELELKIPYFGINDHTECLFRNVEAFEQLQYPKKTHVCNYIFLMDFLIETEKDVDFLVEKEIIFNFIGDNESVATMFNKLGLQITPSSSCYYDVLEKLKKHYKNRWNHAKATLKNVYFGDPWRGTGTVAAAVLLVLTLVQTVCSILQVL